MKKTKSVATKAKEGNSPSRLIDGRIKELNDWRGATLARSAASSKRLAPMWSRNGSGAEFRCGNTPASSALAKLTRLS